MKKKKGKKEEKMKEAEIEIEIVDIRDTRNLVLIPIEEKKEKKVALNNNLYILSILLIGKKYILLTNIMKNITKKINLI
jgi:hypothetical protein